MQHGPSWKTYSEAMDVVTEELAVAHLVRLGLELNFTVYHYEMLQNQEKARHLAHAQYLRGRYRGARQRHGGHGFRAHHVVELATVVLHPMGPTPSGGKSL